MHICDEIFVLRKKGSKTKERMKEEEIEKGDCGQVRQNQKKKCNET